jgi:hypothetical protein
MAVVPSNWNLPEIFVQRLGTHAGKQRTMSHGGHLLLILHDVPEPHVPERRGLLYWHDEGGAWRTSDQSDDLGALDALLDRYQARIDRLEAALDAATVSKDYFEILKASAPTQRSSAHLAQALQAAREALPEERRLIDLRDRAAEIQRAAELVHAEAQHGLEYEIASNAEAQAQLANDVAIASNRLNLLAALFFPLTAVTSAFGMNLKSGFEGIGETLLFWLVMAAGLAMGLFLRGKLDIGAPRLEPGAGPKPAKK